MKTGVIILIIVVLLVFWFGSTFVSHRNEMVTQARSRQLGMVAGGRGVATPQ